MLQEHATPQATLLLVGNFLSSSGRNPTVAEHLCDFLTERGWVVLTSSRKPGRLARLIDVIRTVWYLRHRYRAAQIDVYSGKAFFLAEAASWALRAAGRPYILSLHGGNLPRFARRWPGRVRRVLQRAWAVTAPSPYLVEEMAPYRRDVYLLPNPLDLEQYPYRIRQEVQPRLVWLRAFRSIYNPTLAVRVLALLAREFPSVHLVMAGPDTGDGTFEATRRAAKDLNVESYVDLLGAIPKSYVPHYLARGDIFLNTTTVDNAPTSVLEALACGLCVVTTCVGGIPFLLAHETNALLVPNNEPSAMANAVRRILTEPALAQRLSAYGRQVVQPCDRSRVVAVWESLFREVVANRRSQDRF